MSLSVPAPQHDDQRHDSGRDGAGNDPNEDLRKHAECTCCAPLRPLAWSDRFPQSGGPPKKCCHETHQALLPSRCLGSTRLCQADSALNSGHDGVRRKLVRIMQREFPVRDGTDSAHGVGRVAKGEDPTVAAVGRLSPACSHGQFGPKPVPLILRNSGAEPREEPRLMRAGGVDEADVGLPKLLERLDVTSILNARLHDQRLARTVAEIVVVELPQPLRPGVRGQRPGRRSGVATASHVRDKAANQEHDHELELPRFDGHLILGETLEEGGPDGSSSKVPGGVPS